MKKVVYITGCLGFIGSCVTSLCLKEGWYVIGVDKMTYAFQPDKLEEFMKHKSFKFIKSDICDLRTLYDCDYIINTAAETHVDNSIINSEQFLHSNIYGVHNLLEQIRCKTNFKMPILFHFSTDEVYGDIQIGSHTEKDLLMPSNPYSATKAAADMLILSWARTYKVPYIIVRPTNNYGCGQYVEKLIPKSCKFIQLGKKIPLHNNGTPKRVWLNVQDTARAVIHIIKANIQNEIFNISGNIELQNIEVVSKIVKLLTNNDNPLPYCDMLYTKRDGQDIRYSLDDSKLRKLGWENIYRFDDELPSIVKYYQNNFIW